MARKYTKSAKWRAAIEAMRGIPVADRGKSTRTPADPAGAETATTAEKRKNYLGRVALLKIINGKSDSTKLYLLKKIEEQLRNKDVAKRKIAALAKTLGVRVSKLELR